MLHAAPYSAVETTVAGQWLQCNGVAVSRTTYSALFSALNALGLPFGAGNGSTTFNIPDLRGRVPVGQGTHADVDALGDSDGQAIASRTPKHNHSVTGIPVGSQFMVQTAGDRDFNFTGPWAVTPASVLVGPQVSAPTDAPAHLVVGSWFIRY